MLEYKGYVGEYEVDHDAGVIHGRLVGIQAIVTFESETAAGLREEFETSVDVYLDWCARDGVEPERPFSGRFVVRIRPSLHRDLVVAARRAGGRAGESLNAFAGRALEQSVRGGSGANAGGPVDTLKTPTRKRGRTAKSIASGPTPVESSRGSAVKAKGKRTGA